jgi:hypothetical protein
VVSNEVLSKALSISRKAPSVNSLFSTASSICAVSADFPGRYANWYGYRCRSPKNLDFC